MLSDLTRTQQNFLLAIWASDGISASELARQIYRSDVPSPAEKRLVRVHLHKLRKRLLPHGVAIGNRRGPRPGYFLSEQDRARVFDGMRPEMQVGRVPLAETTITITRAGE